MTEQKAPAEDAKQRNLQLRNSLKQRLRVGWKDFCLMLICPCDAEQRAAGRNQDR